MKIIKKLSKASIAILLVFGFTLMCFQPITNVFADDTYNVVITFNVAEESGVTLQAKNNEEVVAYNSVGNELEGRRAEDSSRVDFKDTSDNTKVPSDNVRIVCTDNKNCTATVTLPNGHGVRVVKPGDAPFSLKDGENDYNFSDSNITTNKTLTFADREEEFEPFDGKAYLIWACKDGGVCYHYFDNIDGENPMFINEDSIKDDNNGETFDVHSETKAFALKKDFDNWKEQYKAFKHIDEINWRLVDIKDIIGAIDMREFEDAAVEAGFCNRNVDEDTFHDCVDTYVLNLGTFNYHIELRPVGEPTLNNGYVSYGDRRFKVIIYNNDYRGISIGSLDDLNYYPPVWADGLLRTDSYDISDTSIDNPVDIDTALLESTTNIKALQYNGFEIKSIETLDVPEAAVSVTKVNDEFKIRFRSNFYDKVVFKVTSTKDEILYFRINRITINTNDVIRFREGEKSVDLYLDFYFSKLTKYSEYSIIAKIEYKDGSSKIVELENTKEIDDGLGNKTYEYELDLEHPPYGLPGKGLKQANYKYSFTVAEAKKIDSVYINVEFNGSTSLKYAGAFSGSGKGILVKFEEEVR